MHCAKLDVNTPMMNDDDGDIIPFVLFKDASKAYQNQTKFSL